MWMKSVFKKDEAQSLVMDFKPGKFPHKMTKSATEFVERQTTKPSSFKLNPILADQSGISQAQTASLEQRIEHMVLDRVKEIQEQAHEQAYQLGLHEGRDKSFKDHEEEITAKLAGLDKCLQEMESIKTQLTTMNESSIMRLVFQIAEKMTMSQIQIQPEVILEVLKRSTAAIQADEEITIKLSPVDIEFVDSVKDTLGRDFDKLKVAKLVKDESIEPGGCIVETNYGIVDASVPERVKKVWESLADILPKVKDRVQGQPK